MRTERLAAVACVLAAAGAPPVAGGQECALGDALATPTRALQDDVGAGADAPDTRALAAHLPGYGRHGAWLDPPVARDGADLDDWHAVHLPEGALARLAVARDALAPPGVAYVLEAWPPGGAGPAHVLDTDAGEMRFLAEPGGVWALHAAPAGVAGHQLCAGAGAPLATAAAPTPPRSHWIEVACEARCVGP